MCINVDACALNAIGPIFVRYLFCRTPEFGKLSLCSLPYTWRVGVYEVDR